MPKDKVKEGSCRLGALLQMYIGPKMFQALEGTARDLTEPDARISNEARVILEKALPAFGMSAQLPPITTEPASFESLKEGSLKGIGSLITRIEPKLEDLQGPGPAVSAYRFSWNAAYYLQIRKYAPHHERDIQATRKALLEHGALLAIGRNQVQEFLAGPKGRWGPTFDLVTAPQKRTFLERLEPKEPKYPLDGEAADDLIRRWLAGM
ncbi:MAG TPA: hypothetical protein VMT31_02150 [Methanomicrobiales archaeon]|jgi:hypothetical protein|nr:hypothetical protein [Methanomicrobiales archaeon]